MLSHVHHAPRRRVVGAAIGMLLLVTTSCAARSATADNAPTGTGSASAAAACDDTSGNPDVGDLGQPAKKDIAMQLVSSAENSSLNWRAQYKYLEDIADGRGYTGGLIGFTSGTGDMLQLVRDYTDALPDNPLAPFIPALRAVNGTDSHDGLGAPFEQAWQRAATEAQYKAAFDTAQDKLRDSVYFTPAVSLAKADGLPALGQFAYYDAAVVHGPGSAADSLGDIRRTALRQAKSPAQGGSLACFLDAFWQARIVVMKKEPAHQDVSRITDLEQKLASDGNYDLRTPLTWHVYGEAYTIA